MKTLLLLLFMTVASLSMAQNSYVDSIKQYQQNYKDSMFKVVHEDTAYIKFHAINKSLKVVANVEILENQPVFKLTTSSGKTKEAQKFAIASFTLKGKKHSLFIYQLMQLKQQKETEHLLFLPFLDLTNGKTSYIGGRYLDFKIGDIVNNTLVIDFNKNYNPYCAFVTGYNCPIPPRENKLNIAIDAGESYDKVKFKH